MKQHFLVYLATLTYCHPALDNVSLRVCLLLFPYERILSPKITAVRPVPLDTYLTKYHYFLIYRAFAFLSTLRPQWYCRTIPDPANSTWVKKYPIVEVSYKVTLAASIVLMMTISKEILLGNKMLRVSWVDNESPVFSSGIKTVHAWELKPMSLRPTRLYASMSFHAPPYFNLFQKKKQVWSFVIWNNTL